MSTTMAKSSLTIDARPAEVWAVLGDARTYDRWVVGCDDIRAVEGDWPAVGSRFFHTVGVGPIKTKDSTTVVECRPDERLVLEARARPAGVARVIFTLEQVDGAASTGTDVTIEEFPIKGVARLIDNPLQDGAIKVRNLETLRRLARQVSEHQPR